MDNWQQIYRYIICSSIQEGWRYNTEAALIKLYAIPNTNKKNCFAQQPIRDLGIQGGCVSWPAMWLMRHIPSPLAAIFAARGHHCCPNSYSDLHHNAECLTTRPTNGSIPNTSVQWYYYIWNIHMLQTTL